RYSRNDFNNGAERCHAPKLFDLGIGEGNTAGGPVRLLVGLPCVVVRLAVNLDVGSGRYSALRRPRAVLLVRIRGMERKMMVALALALVDAVNALRRFPVAFLLFCACRIPAKRDVICFQTPPASED